MASTNSYGYASYYKPPNQQSLAQAAAAKDPYGLAPNNRSGPLGIGSSTGFAAPSSQSFSETGVGPSTSQAVKAAAASPLNLQAAQHVAASTPPPVASTTYDLNTDPALQQIQALAGLNNQQAQAEALKEQQNLLLQYGDPTIAAAVLGQSDPLVQAAAQNPTSTVNQLGQQRDQNLKTLDNGLNAQNLIYSGYRVDQEQQNAQNYQNALAQAAAGLNSNLDQVTSNLNGQLSANNSQIADGINAAAARAAQNATTSGTDPGAYVPPTTSSFINSAGAGGGPAESQISGLSNVPAGLSSALAAALGIGNGGLTAAKQKQLLSLFG